MRICFVSHSSKVGGGERSLLETIRALRAHGVVCAALLPDRGPLYGALREMGIAVSTLPYRSWTARAGLPAWRRLARLAWNLALAPLAWSRLRRFRADLVYTNTVATPLGAFAAALAGVPHVWHLRELAHEHSGRLFDLGARRALRWMDRLSVLFLTNSRCVADYFRSAFGEKIEVVYQAVDPPPPGMPPAEVPPRDGLRLIAVGALSPAKHQEEAIEAVAILQRAGIPADLVVLGEGDAAHEAALRARVESLGLVDRVHFLGTVQPAYPHILAADVVVNCSRQEAFGRVTVEAMLAGRPLVGARSAGTAEIVEDGRHGWLYEPGDVDALASRLLWILDHPADAARVAAAARAWATERFTGDRYGDEVLALLRRAAARGAAAS